MAAYEKQTWVDLQTPLDAAHMNHIEEGIASRVGITSIKQTTTSTADGGNNVITATLDDGTTETFNIKNGSKGGTGSKGDTGAAGVGIKSVVQTTTSSADGGNNVITVTKDDGTTSTFTVKNGSKGSTGAKGEKGDPGEQGPKGEKGADGAAGAAGKDGKDGAAGATPVKGKDYYTDADKAEMVEAVKDSIDGLDELIGSGVAEVTHVPNIGGFMKVDIGAISSMDDTWHTDYIALAGYKTIKAQCNISSMGYALAFFDEYKTILPSISVVGVGSSVTKTIEMEVPTNAAYCMLSDYEYGGRASDAYITLYPVNGLIERMDDLEAAMASPLNGKTIAVLGDSISSVDYTTPNYWQLIAEKTGCKFLDYGVSGSCFAVRTGSTTSFVERAANMEAADAVLVMGGTNDAGKDILLGEWASTDNTTLYGALNDLISLLRTKYYGKPIVFCTPIKSMYIEDSGFPGTMEDLKTANASTNLELWHCALAIKAKCAVHGIPVIDLFNESGIGSQSSVFFREDDKLHPSDLGECRIANMVQPMLEQQFLHTVEYDDTPPASYTNLVPTSTDTDGSIYNGVGYKDNARLGSSGSVSSSAQTGSVVTGFIPWTNTDVICMKGAEWVGTYEAYGGFYYLSLYNASKTLITNGYVASGTYSEDARARSQLSAVYDSTTGITTFSIIDPADDTGVFRIAAKQAAYFRINAYGKGADLIITVNEEIT